MKYINKYAEINYRQTLYLACKGVLRVKQAESSGIIEKRAAEVSPQLAKLYENLINIASAAVEAQYKDPAKLTKADKAAIEQYNRLYANEGLRGLLTEATRRADEHVQNNIHTTIDGANSAPINIANSGGEYFNISKTKGSNNSAVGIDGAGVDDYFDDDQDDVEEVGADNSTAAIANAAGHLVRSPRGGGILYIPGRQPIRLTEEQCNDYEQLVNTFVPAGNAKKNKAVTQPQPGQPVQPGQQVQPGQPGKPAKQVKPGKPSQPVQPGQPAQAEQPVQPGQQQGQYRLGKRIRSGPNKGKYLFMINGQQVIRDSKFATKADYDAFVAQYQAEHPNEKATVDPTTGEVTSQDADGHVTVSDPDTGKNVAIVDGSGDANSDLVTTMDTGANGTGNVDTVNTLNNGSADSNLVTTADTGTSGTGNVDTVNTLNSGSTTPPNTPPDTPPNTPPNTPPTISARDRFIDDFMNKKNTEFDNRWSGAGLATGLATGALGWYGGGKLGDSLSHYMKWDENPKSWKHRLAHWGSRLLGAAALGAGGYYTGKGFSRAAKQDRLRNAAGVGYDRAVNEGRPESAEPQRSRQLSLFGGYADEPEPTQVHRASYASRLVKKLRNQVGYRYIYK